MISAQVKLKAALAGETSLSSCCLIWVLLWSDPEGSTTVTRACRGQTARSHFVNPCHVPVRFLIHKNGKEGELTPAYLPFALPCCCLNSYRKTDILLTPNDRGWREDEGNGRLCRLMFGVRPSSLEQTSNTLEECFRQNGLLVSERNSQTLIEKKKDGSEVLAWFRSREARQRSERVYSGIWMFTQHLCGQSISVVFSGKLLCTTVSDLGLDIHKC